jgi:hypothetical protein
MWRTNEGGPLSRGHVRDSVYNHWRTSFEFVRGRFLNSTQRTATTLKLIDSALFPVKGTTHTWLKAYVLKLGVPVGAEDTDILPITVNSPLQHKRPATVAIKPDFVARLLLPTICQLPIKVDVMLKLWTPLP